MNEILTTATLIGATLTTGLTAGLMFAFAHGVLPGLATLGDHAYLTAFQRIDAAIQNPWMGLAYLGSPVLALAAGLLQLRDRGAALPWVAVALVLILTSIAITARVHLPLNAAVQAAAPGFPDAAALREQFEGRWLAWNWVRAATSTGALVALCGALLTTVRSTS